VLETSPSRWFRAALELAYIVDIKRNKICLEMTPRFMLQSTLHVTILNLTTPLPDKVGNREGGGLVT